MWNETIITCESNHQRRCLVCEYQKLHHTLSFWLKHTEHADVIYTQILQKDWGDVCFVFACSAKQSPAKVDQVSPLRAGKCKWLREAWGMKMGNWPCTGRCPALAHLAIGHSSHARTHVIKAMDVKSLTWITRLVNNAWRERSTVLENLYSTCYILLDAIANCSACLWSVTGHHWIITARDGTSWTNLPFLRDR